jgi:hypothetical protein
VPVGERLRAALVLARERTAALALSTAQATAHATQRAGASAAQAAQATAHATTALKTRLAQRRQAVGDDPRRMATAG